MSVKIEITLPDWCDERDIVIMAGIEQVAYKHATESTFKIKQTRCNKCGECCKGFHTESGYCDHIVLDGNLKICGLGTDRSYACCIGDPVMDSDDPSVCCITYVEA